MRKKNEQLREQILKEAWQLAEAEGSDAVNIRAIAGRCEVSVGSVYNYFDSKEAILMAMAGEYWARTLAEMEGLGAGLPFPDQLAAIFAFLSNRLGDFRTGLMSMMRSAANRNTSTEQQQMQQMLHRLAGLLVQRISEDKAVAPGLWTNSFTLEKYAVFVQSNLLAALERREQEIEFLMELVRRTLYRQ